MTDVEIQKVFARWAARERAARGRIIFSVPTFSAKSVPGYSSRPVSASLIRTWRRQRRIFAVRYRGRDYFPAFQFLKGEPKSLIAELLCLLRPADNWQSMFWFCSANAWVVDHQQPFAVLDSNPEAVIEAARHANDQISD